MTRRLATIVLVSMTTLAARGATPSAFERRCIPSGCVAPPSHIPDILGRRALPAGRLAVLGATMDLHHGLLASAQAPMFSTRREVVRVDVLVSSNGQPVKGLVPADFEIRDNGVLQHVDLAGFEEIPLNVILALDMSDSVAGEKLEHLRSASKGVLTGLKKEDRASLVTFSHIVAQRSELTSDVDRVRAALDEAEGTGSTALVDGIYASMLLGEAEPGRTLIIAFSDGVDTASWLSPEALIDTARRSEAVVYSVSTGKADESPFLRELSQATGGELLEIESTRDLNALFLRIFNEFRYRYLVSYSPSGVDRAGWHRLQVRVKRGNATVKARPGYQKGS